MEKRKIYCGYNYWVIDLPEDWEDDFDPTNYGEYSYYPAGDSNDENEESNNGSDLTIRITPFHIEDENEEPAPAESMRNVFLNSVTKTMGVEKTERINIDDSFFEELPDFEKMAFQTTYIDDDGKEVLWISIGIYKKGELLIFNIFGSDKDECAQSLLYLRTLDFIDE